MSYHETTYSVYLEAAEQPQEGLCCTTTPVWRLPELTIPEKMLTMNYGCGSTVHPRDLTNEPKVLYVGVGGGMELLQFAYFSRRPGMIIGVDTVDEMLQVCAENLVQAEEMNSWFSREFVSLSKGDAMYLPIDNASVDVAAQNCLFNIFKQDDLKLAIAEMYRVLKPGGRLVLSDPVCEQEIPKFLREDQRLRAQCLTGVIPIQRYIDTLTEAGFGTVEIRARRPYRLLSPNHYAIDKLIMIESVEVCAIKDPMPVDGPCVFTGKTAIYHGEEDHYDDGAGHILARNQPVAVCDKTAAALGSISQDIHLTDSTWFYDGGGCC